MRDALRIAMKDAQMKPSEVRARVLAEHVKIRSLLNEVEFLAAPALAGDLAKGLQLHGKTVELYNTMYEHMSMEDELLYPAIREVDAWGFLRALRLRNEHEAQRAGLSDLANIAWRGNTIELARVVQTLAIEIREDMEREESELLNPDLLRDDVISIGQSTG